MTTVNIEEAETRLSDLLDEALAGNAFQIARAGRPTVQVKVIESPEPMDTSKRFGFMRGQFTAPDDFDEMMRDEIEAMFEPKKL